MKKSPQGIIDSVRWYSGGDLEVLRSALYAYLDKGQELPPHLQIIAPAATLVTLCNAVGLNPHDVINTINNMATDLDAPFAHTIDAARQYAQGELF